MSTFPRILLFLLNIGILTFGIFHIVFAKNMSETSSINSCLRESVSSLQWIGVTSSVVAVIGIIGTCFKVKALQCIYILALLISIISIIVFSVFLWAIMPGISAVQVYVQTAEHGVWIPEYGTIFQKTVANEKDWSATKDCFREIDTCRIMANQTWDKKVIYIDIGCCIPPNRCGLEQASTGHWVTPKHGLNSTDDECQMWARVGLNCFECDSCKAAYLGNYQETWDKSTTSRIESMVTLIATLALSYYTFVHDHYHGDIKDSKYGKFVGALV